MVESFMAHSSLPSPEKALSNVIDDLYSYLKSQALIRIKRADIQRKLPALCDYIENVRLVKTLWQIDKAVDVESFYCDSHVVLRRTRGKKTYRKRIDFVADLNSHDNFVIQGIAGQGKSILLRHLFVNQTLVGTHIPIFIELRRIQSNETLLTHISRFLRILDLPSDDALTQILLKSGKFMFFLDGFDEIPHDQMPSILNELEYLTSISRSCQFIVTSRLNSPVAMSPLFNVVLLDDLRGNEYQKVIRKLSDTKKYAGAVIARVRAQEPGVSELLCTPLLVTLLLVSYKSYQAIPIQLSDFYESIFMNLLQRHDGTKPAFSRPRKCSLNDNQYRHVFDAFCFESKKQDSKVFEYQQIYSFADKAMSLLDINEDVDAYIQDIKNITCLLLEESNQYRFIHGTVQEYYSASFIRSLPEPSALKFYQACLDPHKAYHWSQELAFLTDIDSYRHTKYFLLPLCSSSMGYEQEVDPTFLHPAEISLERTKRILSGWELSLSYDEGKPRCTSVAVGFIFQSFSYTTDQLDVVHHIFSFDYTELWDSIASGKTAVHIQERPATISSDTGKHIDVSLISIKQILDEGFLTSEFKSIAQTLSFLAYTRWHQGISLLNKQHSFIETVEFI